ncbi:uncharacterized protein MKK02DRAFT_44989 [Dioszegia hungarica]|uniref:Ca3427-like PBP 2 domain-containing protein n=1 Tax=Dioszegia hungarica TaxID=4972 RepID=A0AA38LUV5_9TREE|nr:uncharacterized protein MKK02DRAFT_44989 [Dioszegia hungarica]KAI9636285.1 hypothetical protein MKK02DRAFT_44989 [Dioszegia hungarica]
MSKPLRVGWHREHFLSPLLQFAAEDKGETFELVECPGGTGEMQVKMKEGEIDVCIALTDALIAGLANGQTAAIITGKDSQYNSVSDLKGTTFGISRLGSGSQVMASVLAMNEGWTEADVPKFKVNGQFKPLRDSVNAGETSVFLWEWFTTKPFVDSGEVRFIGSVYTPWPSWSFAATPSTSSSQISQFLKSLQPFVTRFNSAEARAKDDIDFVVENFGQQRADVEEWIQTVRWEERMSEVDESVVRETLRVLTKAGVVKEGEWDMDLFVRSDVATLV